MNMMTSALQDYRHIWRVTTAQRAEGSVKLIRRLGWLALAGGAVVLAIAVARHALDAGTAARLLVGIGTFWLALVWTLLFVPGSMLLNAAANARLVPRQRRRLMQMAAGGWLLLTLALTVVAGTWTALPVVGLYLIAFALMFGAANIRAVVPMLIVGNWGWASRSVLPPALVEALASDTAMALLAVLLVPAGVWTLRRMYAPGGDAQFIFQDTLRRHMARLEGRGGAALQEGRSARAYTAALRRDARHGQRADPGRMLMHALGPSAHWSAWAGSIAAMLAAGIVVHLLRMWQENGGGSKSLHDMIVGASSAGLAMLMLTILFSTAAFGQAIARTRGEQALLRLAPLAADTALLNRRLAAQLLRRALGLWAALTVAILCVSVLAAGPGVLLRQFGLCCLAGQVAMMGLLGDYAGQGGWRPALAWRAACLALLEMLAAAGLAWVSGISVWVWMAAIALAMAGFRLRRSWQAMLAAPVAFPARRMG